MEQVAFPVEVVAEFRFGARCASDPQQRLAEVDALVRTASVIPADLGTAQAYAGLRTRLRASGTPLQENDVSIAATCLQHNLTLLTLDGHFQHVEGLSVRGE